MPNSKKNTGPRPLAGLVDEAARLKVEQSEKKEILYGLNQTLAKRVIFKNGSATAHALGHYFKAKIQLKTNTKWDQEILHEVRTVMGDAEFFKVFKCAFEPQSTKALSGALEFGSHGELICKAMTVTEGTPAVTFEELPGV